MNVLILQSIVEFLMRTFLPEPAITAQQLSAVKIVAHRGKTENQKENSLEGFKACMEEGIWGVEFDIRWTKDNVPVVIHDPDLLRTHGINKQVSELTTHDLEEIQPKILKLKDVIEILKGKSHMMIELKEPLNEEREEVLAKLLESLAPKKDYHLMSLQTSILEQIARFPSDCLIGISIFKSADMIKDVERNNWAGLAGSYILLGKQEKSRLENSGRIFGTGYIDSEYAFKREVSRGVEYLFTNKPILLKRARATF